MSPAEHRRTRPWFPRSFLTRQRLRHLFPRCLAAQPQRTARVAGTTLNWLIRMLARAATLWADDGVGGGLVD
jgi:hypothetical protein